MTLRVRGSVSEILDATGSQNGDLVEPALLTCFGGPVGRQYRHDYKISCYLCDGVPEGVAVPP